MPDIKERLVRFGLIPGIEDLAAVRKRADDDYTEFCNLLAEAELVLKSSSGPSQTTRTATIGVAKALQESI